MILTKDNTDEVIIDFIIRSGHDCYDGKTGKVFSVAPCDYCGALVMLPNDITIESPSEAVHRLLTEQMCSVNYAEFVEYDEDGMERCDVCCYE